MIDKVKWAEGGGVSLIADSPAEVITRLQERVKRGQQSAEFDPIAALTRERRAGATRRSPLSSMRSPSPSAATGSPDPAPSAGAAPTATRASAQPVPVTAGDNPFQAEAVRLAEKYGLPPGVFVALVNQESRFNPQAVSPKGAVGLTQLMPGTAKELGVDPTDPLQNLEGGARYLRQQLDRFGSLPLALAAYNAGPGNVRKHGGIPPFKETQNYVKTVLRGAGVEGYAGGGVVRKLINVLGGKAAGEVAEKAPTAVPEQKMLQGFYRGYAGDYDALKAGEDTGTVFVSPQKPVGEYYARKRSAQKGTEPHLEMLMADPFAGKQYGHAVPMGPLNRSGVGQTLAREFKPEEIEQITKLFSEGGEVQAFAEGGEVRPPPEMKPTPRGSVTGYAADKLRALQEMAAEYQIPEAVPLLGGMGVDELLGLPAAAREVDRWSYGNYPVRVNPYAGRTASFVPEVKPGRQSDLADTVLLGADLTGVGALAGKYGVKGALAAGRAGEQLAERVVPSVMERGGLGAELLEGMAGGTRSQVIKPKGGNWLSGSIDAVIDPLKSRVRELPHIGQTASTRLADIEAAVAQNIEAGIPVDMNFVEQARAQLAPDIAADKWLDTKLKKYIQNEMATPEDPLRKLAEKGAFHLSDEDLLTAQGWVPEEVVSKRIQAGFPEEGFSAAEYAEEGFPIGPAEDAARRGEGWETLADTAINRTAAGEWLKDAGDTLLQENQWLRKVPPETPVYNMPWGDDLGFSHIVDEMKNAMRPDSDLPDRLRIDPTKLDKMTVPQVVEKVSQINAWRGEQMAAANAAKAMNPATQVVKEYPDQGYKWVELKAPKSGESIDDGFGNMSAPGYDELEQALKYEGDTMGHCVGGYCDDVYTGNTRIYSLRDAKGEPHVTIEVQPQRVDPYDYWYKQAPESERAEFLEWLRRKPSSDQTGLSGWYRNWAEETGREIANPPPIIKQIKGKQNRAPKDEYLPFVQDFVKGGQWSEVGDIANAGLVRYKGEYRSPAEFEYRVEDGGWQNLLQFAQERFPDQPSRQNNFITGIMQDPEAVYIRPAQPPQQGFAEGGLVSAYNPADIDALVNQVLEGTYV